MSVLTIKEINDTVMKLINKQETPDLELSARLLETFTVNSEKAQEIILSRMDEKTFARLRSTVISITLSIMTVTEGGASLMKAHTRGELVTFVDTVTLTILGM